MKSEYCEEFAANKLIKTFTALANEVSNHFGHFWPDNNDFNTYLALLSSNAAEKLHAHLFEQLVSHFIDQIV